MSSSAGSATLTPIVVGGTPYGAETLTGHLLAGVVEVALEQGIEAFHLGSRPTTAPPPARTKLDLLR